MMTLAAVLYILFVPGFALVTALLPRGRTTEERWRALLTFERLVLSVATSIVLAVVVGINLDHIQWEITGPNVMLVLVVISIVAGAIAVVRQRRARKEDAVGDEPGNERGAEDATDVDPTHEIEAEDSDADEDPNEGSGDESDTASDDDLIDDVASDSRSLSLLPASNVATPANVAVVVAMLIVLTSVAFVMASPQRGETYTEFGLLTENETGSLVAAGYPSNMTAGENATLHFSVVNNEQRSETYDVLIFLTRTAENGTVRERQKLHTYHKRLDAQHWWRQPHSISPMMTGERLRLTYLLYKDDVPAKPTTQNSYRELHVWLTVEANETSTTGANETSTTDANETHDSASTGEHITTERNERPEQRAVPDAVTMDNRTTESN
jgi:uncharacterized membrane protein